MKPYNYEKLSANGFVDENGHVEAGDVLIGKCMPQKQGSTIINKDTSVALKSNERGFVDRNCHGDRYFTNVTGDGYTFAKVRMRNERVPTIGDKVSSRHGQKVSEKGKGLC
jgi:DNA-directed RNA polymerase II subunit RPB2